MTIWSDFHWGEVVDKSQVYGVNSYNMSIAKQRLHTLVDKTIGICFDHMVNPNYPGIVLMLGGDMVSGDIHEELEITNEAPSGPVLVDLLENLRVVRAGLVEPEDGRGARGARAAHRNVPCAADVRG